MIFNIHISFFNIKHPYKPTGSQAVFFCNNFGIIIITMIQRPKNYEVAVPLNSEWLPTYSLQISRNFYSVYLRLDQVIVMLQNWVNSRINACKGRDSCNQLGLTQE